MEGAVSKNYAVRAWQRISIPWPFLHHGEGINRNGRLASYRRPSGRTRYEYAGLPWICRWWRIQIFTDRLRYSPVGERARCWVDNLNDRPDFAG